ncbi:hypothetical protein PAPYR_3483 [Paratrimastix pyriformis]|uniref:Uncharacterized protein n=1 Tax=Paratrimastix pyriformis TaxID=342808 RepID=A0ABQ8URV4_9EUKA|nr:hypothetical protein PAPYR_3483 [Paratrimastix pyriformis]
MMHAESHIFHETSISEDECSDVFSHTHPTRESDIIESDLVVTSLTPRASLPPAPPCSPMAVQGGGSGWGDSEPAGPWGDEAALVIPGLADMPTSASPPLSQSPSDCSLVDAAALHSPPPVLAPMRRSHSTNAIAQQQRSSAGSPTACLGRSPSAGRCLSPSAAFYTTSPRGGPEHPEPRSPLLALRHSPLAVGGPLPASALPTPAVPTSLPLPLPLPAFPMACLLPPPAEMPIRIAPGPATSPPLPGLRVPPPAPPSPTPSHRSSSSAPPAQSPCGARSALPSLLVAAAPPRLVPVRMGGSVQLPPLGTPPPDPERGPAPRGTPPCIRRAPSLPETHSKALVQSGWSGRLGGLQSFSSAPPGGAVPICGPARARGGGAGGSSPCSPGSPLSGRLLSPVRHLAGLTPVRPTAIAQPASSAASPPRLRPPRSCSDEPAGADMSPLAAWLLGRAAPLPPEAPPPGPPSRIEAPPPEAEAAQWQAGIPEDIQEELLFFGSPTPSHR